MASWQRNEMHVLLRYVRHLMFGGKLLFFLPFLFVLRRSWWYQKIHKSIIFVFLHIFCLYFFPFFVYVEIFFRKKTNKINKIFTPPHVCSRHVVILCTQPTCFRLFPHWIHFEIYLISILVHFQIGTYIFLWNLYLHSDVVATTHLWIRHGTFGTWRC